MNVFEYITYILLIYILLITYFALLTFDIVPVAFYVFPKKKKSKLDDCPYLFIFPLNI